MRKKKRVVKRTTRCTKLFVKLFSVLTDIRKYTMAEAMMVAAGFSIWVIRRSAEKGANAIGLLNDYKRLLNYYYNATNY